MSYSLVSSNVRKATYLCGVIEPILSAAPSSKKKALARHRCTSDACACPKGAARSFATASPQQQHASTTCLCAPCSSLRGASHRCFGSACLCKWPCLSHPHPASSPSSSAAAPPFSQAGRRGVHTAAGAGRHGTACGCGPCAKVRRSSIDQHRCDVSCTEASHTCESASCLCKLSA